MISYGRFIAIIVYQLSSTLNGQVNTQWRQEVTKDGMDGLSSDIFVKIVQPVVLQIKSHDKKKNVCIVYLSSISFYKKIF